MNEYIFSRRYRIWRHVLFWTVYTLLTASMYVIYTPRDELWRHWFIGLLWLPARMLYCYPFMYWVIPRYLLNKKYVQFSVPIVLLWFAAGWLLNFLYRSFVHLPVMKALKFPYFSESPFQPDTFLLLTTAAGVTSIIKLFQYWFRKQQEWQQAEKEKIKAELQLLKAQVHPHFLFNTLNNIYSFSLDKSSKTPELILKLSSLLSYMLYDCKAEEVRLEKEVEIMKNYIDLEKERYGDKIEISWNVEGETKDKFISPLLMLPFLENAFKHGASEQIEKPWLGVDISVANGILKCKITNSKNEYAVHNNNGIGINNVKKRLEFLYPGKHELKINDEGDFFTISLMVKLFGSVPTNTTPRPSPAANQTITV